MQSVYRDSVHSADTVYLDRPPHPQFGVAYDKSWRVPSYLWIEWGGGRMCGVQPLTIEWPGLQVAVLGRESPYIHVQVESASGPHINMRDDKARLLDRNFVCWMHEGAWCEWNRLDLQLNICVLALLL